MKKKGSRRRKRLIRSKRKQLKKLRTQIKDMLHKQTSRLITTLHARGVQTLVIGDVRDIRQDNDGEMAPPTGLRYLPHVQCSSPLLEGPQQQRQREAAAL